MDSTSVVPPHLRRYIVEQDYGQYTARDQAVWRFVIQQIHARLCETAHASYARGFEGAGISVEHIPDIPRMGERLASAGFRTVCVDGFIPPRAFQAFQARGVLPIAADIRGATQLTYTPAPDIIHEAAGHAPLLCNAEYARFLRRIGAVSEHAFEIPHDRALYQAIYTLSEIKQDPAATPLQVRAAEAELAALRAQPHPLSEATRMARLYWWTVEYGLLGTPERYALYGAGLLSSIAEGHFCHAPAVKKLPLDADCVDVDYDITRAQPQLFVARDFAHLEEVLDQVASTLSHRRGGEVALTAARESGEVASVSFDTGVQVAGCLRAFDAALLALSGPCLLARELTALAHFRCPDGDFVVPLGWLEDGTSLSHVSVEQLKRHVGPTGRLRLVTRGGITLLGRLGDLAVQGERVLIANVEACEVWRGEQRLLRADAAYPLVFAEAVTTASPAVPDGYYAPTAYSGQRVPKPRSYSRSERTLIDLHERALAALHGRLGADASAALESMHRVLSRRFPEEWLLRFNLLEALIAIGEGEGELGRGLERELEQLELRFQYREPIASGLSFLRSLAGPRRRDSQRVASAAR